MILRKLFYTYDQAEDGGEGAAGGGSQPAADASGEDAGGAGAPPAQPEAGEPAAAPAAGTDGKPAAAGEQYELNWNGKKIAVNSREEAVALMQKGYNVTQKEQEVSKLRKELLTKHERADRLFAELERLKQEGRPAAEGEEASPQDPPDKVTQLEQQVRELRDRHLEEQWGKIFSPIATKYPDVPELELAQEFQKALEAGDVENTAEGVEQIAAKLAENYTTQINQRLEKQLSNPESPLVKAHNDKVVTALLADINNPKLTDYNQKVIAAYMANKMKLANAGGDGGKGGGAGAATDKKLTISEVAAKFNTGE
jgi:hypothetical protein